MALLISIFSTVVLYGIFDPGSAGVVVVVIVIDHCCSNCCSLSNSYNSNSGIQEGNSVTISEYHCDG